MIIEQMSVAVIPGKNQQLGNALAAMVGPIQVQPGCLSCRLFQSWPHQEQLRMETRWASQDDLIRHLQSEDYKRLLLLIELSPSRPALEFYTVLEIRGLDLVEAARDSSV